MNASQEVVVLENGMFQVSVLGEFKKDDLEKLGFKPLVNLDTGYLHYMKTGKEVEGEVTPENVEDIYQRGDIIYHSYEIVHKLNPSDKRKVSVFTGDRKKLIKGLSELIDLMCKFGIDLPYKTDMVNAVGYLENWSCYLET